MSPPVQRSQSVYSSSCVLELAGMLWKEQKELKRNLLKGTVYLWVQACPKGLTDEELQEYFLSTIHKSKWWLHHSFPVLKDFLHIYSLRTISLPNSTHTWCAGAEMSWNAAGCSLPAASAELVAEPPPSPFSCLATTCLYCPSTCVSLSLACSISAGKQEKKQNINVLTRGSVPQHSPNCSWGRYSASKDLPGAKSSGAICLKLLTSFSFHFLKCSILHIHLLISGLSQIHQDHFEIWSYL